MFSLSVNNGMDKAQPATQPIRRGKDTMSEPKDSELREPLLGPN